MLSEQKQDLVKKMALQDDFSNAGEIIEYVNRNVKEFYEYFQNIKDLLYKPATDENCMRAFQNFVKIFDNIPLMATKLPESRTIVRARPNYNSEEFSKQSEISFHPNSNEIKANRFNVSGVQIFYGALQTDNKLDFSLTSCLESCKAFTSPNNPVELQDMTIGLWQLNEVLPIVNLCFDEQHLRTNISLKNATNQYLAMLKENYSVEAYEFVLEFFSYFSGLSRENMDNNECYYILSALFEAIKYYYVEVMKVPFTGIIYPSSATEGIGLNIALVPPVINYHILKLSKVGMYRFILNQENNTYNSKPCSNLVDVIDGEFKITNYKPISRI